MKRQKHRLNSVIENDRLIISSEMSSLISYDLKNLLNNYFNVEGGVSIRVVAEQNCYKIEISANASGVKVVNSLRL